MRFALKILFGVGISLSAITAVSLYILRTSFPRVGDAPIIKIERTAERIARGQYLAHHVAACFHCHSERDWDHFAAPVMKGSEGKGGELFPEEAGFAGTLIAPNITPAALADWGDGELLRALTSGVNKTGDVLFPLMPYTAYGQMTQEDVYSVIAYVRTLKSIEDIPPRSSLSFPMNLIVRTIPKPYLPPAPVDGSYSAAYGKYLTALAGCPECHTPKNRRTPLQGMHLAGGVEFKVPTGRLVRSANITPDVETGIGHWKRAYFIAQFKRFDRPEAATLPLQGGFNTVMPWTMFAGMKESDLGAIFDHLQTVSPVKNGVDKFPE
jgi:hypothetical protein